MNALHPVAELSPPLTEDEHGTLRRGTSPPDDVADTRRRTPAFDGRCYLCGQPIDSGGIFCHAHGWAGKGQR